jgi:prevent-host-death family protein
MLSVRIAHLKARLSEHLRRVRRGESVTVLDRDTPIARIVPYDSDEGSLSVRRPAPGTSLRDLSLPPPLKTDIDIVTLLLEERQGGR